MDVRSQIASVFHLDKCIGCHTCSLACKNLWTDRRGAEYMWWNNVETKPGTGYPDRWEDQETWRGGWEVNGSLKLRSQSRAGGLMKLFYNPRQPGLEDYYEPWTYRYDDLFTAPASDDQPTAIPVSQITGAPIDIQSGPNWDDDLSGSPKHAEHDVNLDALDPREREALFEVERLTMMYLPRTCNHCANPACVAACPSGAIYKRGEDGIVLVSQEQCRGWRACVVACPYKKVFYNWASGKSEKCILCYPRLETGQPPACFHACVGRIRYTGVVLYDANRIQQIASVPPQSIVEMQRLLLLDPNDPDVIAGAEKNGVSAQTIAAAQHSPVWKLVREWKIALPLHPELRTLPMIFYVPPLMPFMGRMTEGDARPAVYGRTGDGLFPELDETRLPIRYLASLFSAGNTQVVSEALLKLMAVRAYRRSLDLNDVSAGEALDAAEMTPVQADEIYRLTALATISERFALPPLHREQVVGAAETTRQTSGLEPIT